MRKWECGSRKCEWGWSAEEQFKVSGVSKAAGGEATSLIGKKTYERRTLTVS